MIWAMVAKELKETAWIWLIAAAALMLLALDSMRIPLLPDFVRVLLLQGYLADVRIPFLGGNVAAGVGWVMGLFAVAMGLWQSYGETWRGTYPLLLHLPMPRRTIFGVKIAVGLGLVSGLAAAALLAVSLWASTPGTHASPFEWSMTATAWHTWFAIPVVYLGAFATGLLPARWLGTRLFPLAAAGAVTGFLLVAQEALSLAGGVFFAGVLAAAAVFLAVIDHLVASCDFS